MSVMAPPGVTGGLNGPGPGANGISAVTMHVFGSSGAMGLLKFAAVSSSSTRSSPADTVIVLYVYAYTASPSGPFEGSVLDASTSSSLSGTVHSTSSNPGFSRRSSSPFMWL